MLFFVTRLLLGLKFDYLCAGYISSRDMKRKTIKAKEPVRLRRKKLANGNESLYLDYYNDGKREYDFLKLYLIPEKNASDRMQNEETLRTAEAIKAQRVVALQNNQHGFSNAGTKGRINFISYLTHQAERYEANGSKAYGRSVRNTIIHLIRYKGENIQIKQVDKKFLLGYIDYLNGEASKYFEGDGKEKKRKKISDASKALYWSVVVTALNRAVKDDIILTNPADKIPEQDKPKEGQSTKVYLTFEELKALADTPCKYPDLKNAFLFCCFCALRMCDARRLKWSAIKKTNDGGKQIEMLQQKTGEPVYIPLSANALQYLPSKGRKGSSENVFSLPHVSTIEKWLGHWAEEAGVKKHLTYHVSRHTFATLSLKYGADLYTVSKLMGHSNIQTTQIYAKIVDENKRKAVNLIPDINL